MSIILEKFIDFMNENPNILSYLVTLQQEQAYEIILEAGYEFSTEEFDQAWKELELKLSPIQE